MRSLKLIILFGLVPAMSSPAFTQIEWTEHTVTSSYHRDPSGIGAFDMDQDGDMDIVTGATSFGNGALAWWENDGSQNFVEHFISGEGNFWEIYALDFDQDGDGDILVNRDWENHDYRISLFLNDGSNNFSYQDLHTHESEMVRAKPADLDLDGDMDVIIESRVGEILWMENLGNSTLVSHLIGDLDFKYIFSPFAVDVDSDGDMDLICSGKDLNTSRPQMHWWENDGTMAFTPHLLFEDLTGSEGYGAPAGDLDGDGDQDFIWNSTTWSNWGQIAWLENDGQQNLSVVVIESDPQLYWWAEMHSEDIDQDGDLDILAANYAWNGRVKLYTQNVDGSFTIQNVREGFSGTHVAPPVDMDGDGDLDILGCAFFDNDIAWWESDLNDFRPYQLILHQELGPGSLVCQNLEGEPENYFFNALSSDPANEGAGFGTGWFHGLHIQLSVLNDQFYSEIAPYRGMLDLSGNHTWSLPPGTLSVFAGTTLYAVSLSWDPATGIMHHISPITSLTLE